MTATVRDLILILEVFFPADLSLQKALYLFGVIISLYPLLQLHLNQRRQPRQPARTGWMKTLRDLLISAFQPGDVETLVWASGLDRTLEYANYICDDLVSLYMMLGLNPYDLSAPSLPPLSPDPRIMLCTSHSSCILCPVGDLNIRPTLRRRDKPRAVWLLNRDSTWVQADLVVAHCASSEADYYPDCITYRGNDNHRRQKIEASPPYLRMSRHGVWAHRQVAIQQENALHRFHGGWSNFADWVNDLTGSARTMTYRQSQCLFIEHFCCRLLVFHDKHADFTCEAHVSTRSLAEVVRATIGVNGGVFGTAMSHGCVNCTHVKRYHSDLVNEGVVLGANLEVVAGMGAEVNNNDVASEAHDPAIVQLGLPTQQEGPLPRTPRGYVRLAVMAGKTINHRPQKCALHTCESPLVNYKNGQFCEPHLNLSDVCGIIPCGRPIREPGALTCDDQSHVNWHRKYVNRFSQIISPISFPGVQRVIRQQQAVGNAGGEPGPALRIELDALGNTPGAQVNHTFRAKTTYCLQTVQWACGFPIGWGKCYRSESSPQVLAILDTIWAGYPASKPSFIAYDDACSLLRYVPDLILVAADGNGAFHQTRAFNTETAEQLNSWLTGFESQLREMSDVNYDLFVHILMMIYAERVEKQVDKKDFGLTDEFWVAATG
ncbi:hypothetical protein K438DRAFT_1911243 [Mycena galopus ATCC 62051]|nr:hypothetical protein K438DRAFT_1911243 [Mycena galopus ATCC 62051]